MQIRFLDKVRGQNPLVHNITNGVAMNFTANGLLALGASPIMADEVSEMADMAAICSALLINIGTLRRQTVEAMLAAGKAANARGIPVVFDPVGAAATQFRRDTVERLLAEVRFAAIRGNAAEMAYIAGGAWQGKGVDAGGGAANAVEVAATAAKRYGCVAAVSGATDYVSDGLCTVAGAGIFGRGRRGVRGVCRCGRGGGRRAGGGAERYVRRQIGGQPCGGNGAAGLGSGTHECAGRLKTQGG